MYWKSFLTTCAGACSDHKMPSIRVGIICAVVLAVVVSTLPMTTADANECDPTCLYCSKPEDQNMCTACPTNSSNKILEPPKDCSALFPNCSSNCTDICSSKKQSCECILKTQECEVCRMDMIGKCVQECSYDLKEDEMDTFSGQPVCRVCDPVFLGFCFERYIIWILAVPIAIFIVLLLIIIIVIVCMCRLRRHGRGCWAKSETSVSSSHQHNKPAPPPNRRAAQRRSTDVDDLDHTGEIDAQLQNGVEEITQDDIYGNVDEHQNVLLGQAPIADQNSLRDRQKMMLPHERLINEAQHDHHQDVEEEQEAIYDNEDSIHRGTGAGYIKMNGNVEIEMARMPPHPHSPPSEPEPIEEPIYGNDPQHVALGRHGTAPARRAPDIPTNKKHSSTFPKGIDSSFCGRINEGYDDENPQDDYPDFPTEETFDSMPAYPAPAPPIQKQNNIPSYPAPLPPGEEFDSFPSLPPPAPPTDKSGPKPPKRTTSNVGTTGMPAIKELQQRLNNQSRETSPAKQPVSDLQRQLQASLQVRGEPGGRGPGVLKPKPGGGALKPPGKASTLPLDTAADDSEDSQDEYEYVEDPDKAATNPSPTHQADTGGRKPIPLPQDPSRRPKLAPPTAAKKNKSPPPVPLSKPLSPPSQKSQDFEQEVYEVMDEEANAPDRPRLPAPGEPIEEDLYEPINADDDSGLVYEVTDGPPGRLPVPPPVAQKPALIEDDVYQNEPVMKHPSMNTGRYRNLPADPRQKARMAKVDPYSLRMTRNPPP